MNDTRHDSLTRRDLVKLTAGGIALSMLGPLAPLSATQPPATSDLFSVRQIPNNPFRRQLLGRNHHAGVDCLLYLMGAGGLKFYRTRKRGPLSSHKGMIAKDDVVLIKVNAIWKYRGATNADVVRGLIQAILEHPEGFTGEVVVVDNGQGTGSLDCANRSQYPDDSVQANANYRHHSFTYVVDKLIADSRVSHYLWDPLRNTFIGRSDHKTDGYRTFEDVSYPCFTTAGGRRVELKEGIWTGRGHTRKLKLINIPVLKHHDVGGSEVTAALKNTYGILSMPWGDQERWDHHHYAGLGPICGKMIASVHTPVLNIIDAIWVSHKALSGYPQGNARRVNRLVASQDPVALDYWALKEILYRIDENPRHHPDFEGIRAWMEPARDLINARGGLWKPGRGVRANLATTDEARMRVFSYSARRFLEDVRQVGEGG
jgi:hypothetical protein